MNGEIYGLGVTGYFTEGTRPIPGAVTQFARNGGVMCRDKAGERFFTATRDGSTRVGGFDPVSELARLESPSGKPLAVSFDDASDRLTVVTSRGIARTWSGSSGPRDALLDARTVPVPASARVVRLAPQSGGNP